MPYLSYNETKLNLVFYVVLHNIYYVNLRGVRMIIWLNGPFGVGKTTLANLLHQEIPDSILYDPEYLGDFFKKTSQKLSVQKISKIIQFGARQRFRLSEI